MEIRDAVPSDARAAGQLLRRWLVGLCVAGHRNDPPVLQRCLAKKTPEMVASWIAQAGSSVLVAVEAGAILAVGSVTDTGEVMLNYVSPDARFRGLSRAMLRALENRAVERGNARCTLLSTETARRFYHDAGYAEEGPPQGKFCTSSSYPMSKRLPPADGVSVRLDRVVEELPARFQALRAEARAQGYRHLERLSPALGACADPVDRDDARLLDARV